jgi:hypothetical protein
LIHAAARPSAEAVLDAFEEPSFGDLSLTIQLAIQAGFDAEAWISHGMAFAK